MNVYRLIYYGFDRNYYLIAAPSLEEAIEYLNNEGINVDYDDCWQLDGLTYDSDIVQIIDQN